MGCWFVSSCTVPCSSCCTPALYGPEACEQGFSSALFLSSPSGIFSCFPCIWPIIQVMFLFPLELWISSDTGYGLVSPFLYVSGASQQLFSAVVSSSVPWSPCSRSGCALFMLMVAPYEKRSAWKCGHMSMFSNRGLFERCLLTDSHGSLLKRACVKSVYLIKDEVVFSDFKKSSAWEK